MPQSIYEARKTSDENQIRFSGCFLAAARQSHLLWAEGSTAAGGGLREKLQGRRSKLQNNFGYRRVAKKSRGP